MKIFSAISRDELMSSKVVLPHSNIVSRSARRRLMALLRCACLMLGPRRKRLGLGLAAGRCLLAATLLVAAPVIVMPVDMALAEDPVGPEWIERDSGNSSVYSRWHTLVGGLYTRKDKYVNNVLVSRDYFDQNRNICREEFDPKGNLILRLSGPSSAHPSFEKREDIDPVTKRVTTRRTDLRDGVYQKKEDLDSNEAVIAEWTSLVDRHYTRKDTFVDGKLSSHELLDKGVVTSRYSKMVGGKWTELELYTNKVLTKITKRVNDKDVIEFTDVVDGQPKSVVFRTDDGTFIAEGRRDAIGAWTDKWIDEKGNPLPDSVRPLLAGLAPRAEPSERAALSAFLAEAIPAEAALEAAELELRKAFKAYKTGDDAGLDGLRTARDKLKEQVDNRSKHWKKLVGIATDKGASKVAVSAIEKEGERPDTERDVLLADADNSLTLGEEVVKTLEAAKDSAEAAVVAAKAINEPGAGKRDIAALEAQVKTFTDAKTTADTDRKAYSEAMTAAGKTKDAVKAALGKLSGPDATADTALEGLKTTIADRKLAEEGTPAQIAALSDATRERVNPYLTPEK
ncbi:hypothetical protein, partial [Phyllobacterium sp. 0TCS1.6A]